MIIASTLFALLLAVPSAFAEKGTDQLSPVRRCLDGSTTLLPLPVRVGFLIPTFTLTPYSNFEHSFYAFYDKYRYASGKITQHLDWLSTRVATDWSAPEVNDEKPLYDFLKSGIPSRCGLVLGQNLKFTDDVAVDGGALFVGGVRQYDVLILGHEEYVTRAEYAQLKEFVATGGRLVAMSGNTFWAEVNYSRTTGMETFVIGHGFGFNGAYAWRTTYAPFDSDAAGWFGSTFADRLYNIRGALLATSSGIGSGISTMVHGTVAFKAYTYPHDEVNYLRNMTNTKVIARFYVHADPAKQIYAMPPVPVDAYVHQYGRGQVFCFGVFGQNIIMRDRGAQFFLIYAVEEGFGTARFH